MGISNADYLMFFSDKLDKTAINLSKSSYTMLLHVKHTRHCNGPIQDFRRPDDCSYLQSGQQFQGTQRVSQVSVSASEDWGVQVHIEVQYLLPEMCALLHALRNDTEGQMSLHTHHCLCLYLQQTMRSDVSRSLANFWLSSPGGQPGHRLCMW